MKANLISSGTDYICRWLKIDSTNNIKDIINTLNDFEQFRLDDFTKEIIKYFLVSDKKQHSRLFYNEKFQKILKRKIETNQISLQFIKVNNILKDTMDFHTMVGSLVYFTKIYSIDETIIFIILLVANFKNDSIDIINDFFEFLFFHQNEDGSFGIHNPIDTINQVDIIDEEQWKFFVTIKIVIGLLILEEIEDA